MYKFTFHPKFISALVNLLARISWYGKILALKTAGDILESGYWGFVQTFELFPVFVYMDLYCVCISKVSIQIIHSLFPRNVNSKRDAVVCRRQKSFVLHWLFCFRLDLDGALRYSISTFYFHAAFLSNGSRRSSNVDGLKKRPHIVTHGKHSVIIR